MLTLDLESKFFGAHQVLGACRLSLDSRDRVAIHGPSGIGKSTLLRVISGLDKNFTGRLEIPPRISLMFQNPNLLFWRTVKDNLQIFHPKTTNEDLQNMLEQLGLWDKRHQFPNRLSLGQQRRLALARTFLSSVDLVLLDEPFVSLDPSLRASMISLTDQLLTQSGSALVLVTHDVNDAVGIQAKPYALDGNPACLVVLES